MSFLGLSGWEPLVLLLIFLIIIGPQRLPEYTRNIVRWVRDVRRWVDDSRATVEDEMGIAIDDLRKYDPRQYDPRRIIREAWGDTDMEDILPSKEALTVAGGAAAAGAASRSTSKSGSSASGKAKKDEGPKRAPFDPEAT
ncbi:twin-arginine translocase TatA/TatE family subunit [Brachybacterium muris]|uniref:twin-arginine translocase TatA/TatE family subunit n=1 Tax=Brachybacterium muris TaxID=219301 RepID=UPI000DB41C0D|nr:sec-independent protein translocase protein TatB [Brachybacterium muris]PZP15426.1 MAG: translocase [Brachybacterium faecium]MCT1431289.1 twin-arginine translocase TatA/TatE family subunit [Brachybacterium muris]MCT1655185.1 twin-arginine translocase TatA/TatE family subunit [Brachybacterium muris]MCT1998797.1 twin-arginine translocase TatA/TatE family subunit [Brachybacterium muris]